MPVLPASFTDSVSTVLALGVSVLSDVRYRPGRSAGARQQRVDLRQRPRQRHRTGAAKPPTVTATGARYYRQRAIAPPTALPSCWSPPAAVHVGYRQPRTVQSQNASARCAAYVSGVIVAAGASFTAATVNVTVCVTLAVVPSFATTLIVRFVVVGVLLVSLYRMPCRIDSYTALVAEPVIESTPRPGRIAHRQARPGGRRRRRGIKRERLHRIAIGPRRQCHGQRGQVGRVHIGQRRNRRNQHRRLLGERGGHIIASPARVQVHHRRIVHRGDGQAGRVGGGRESGDATVDRGVRHCAVVAAGPSQARKVMAWPACRCSRRWAGRDARAAVGGQAGAH